MWPLGETLLKDLRIKSWIRLDFKYQSFVSDEIEQKSQKEAKAKPEPSRGGPAKAAREHKWQEKKLNSFAATVLKPLFEMPTLSRFSWKERQEKDNPLCQLSQATVSMQNWH